MPRKNISALFLTVCLFFLMPIAASAADRDAVYPPVVEPVAALLQRGQAHQKAGRPYDALRAYLQASAKLQDIKTANPIVQKAVQDLHAEIEKSTGQIKDGVQKNGLLPYRGKFYTFEALQKLLKKEEERKKRYERFQRWERQERQTRQDQQSQKDERRRFEEQRLQRDYVLQQEQQQLNQDRQRAYDKQSQNQQSR